VEVAARREMIGSGRLQRVASVQGGGGGEQRLWILGDQELERGGVAVVESSVLKSR